MLHTLVTLYLEKFKQRQANTRDRFAPKAILILQELLGDQQGLQGVIDSTLMAEGANFAPIVLSSNNIASYMLMERFLIELIKLNTSIPLAHVFISFHMELSKAFRTFKREIEPSKKDTLMAIFSSLKILIEEPIKKNKVKTSSNSTLEENKNGGLNFPRRMGDKILIHPSLEKFFVEMEALLMRSRIYSADLIQLQIQALDVQKNLLKMPEVREMDRFLWLINALCDFINKNIYYIFESTKVKNINTFFTQLEETIKVAEQKPLDQYLEESSSANP